MNTNVDPSRIFTYFNEINIIAQLSSNRFERALPYGLTISQFSVLNWFVRVDKAATPGRLASAFMVTRGAMTNTLKKLEQKGLVEIVPDESSGRQKIVTLSRQGAKVRNEAIVACGPLLIECLAVLSMSQIDRQLPTLQRLRKYLDANRDP